MKKIMMLIMLLGLFGCGAKENDAITLYQNAFDDTFQSSYASVTIIEQDQGNYVMKNYSQIFHDDTQKGTVSYSLNYEKNQLVNGKITYLEGEDYVVYKCESLEDRFQYESTTSAIFPIKSSLVDPKISKVDQKKSKVTDQGCILYYQLGEMYCISEVEIKEGKIKKEATKYYRDDQYEQSEYDMVVSYLDINSSLEAELSNVKNFKNKGLQDVENILEAK